MSKQQGAPGDLELVREFVNTIDIEEGQEQLQSASSLVGWLAARDLAPRGTRSSRKDLEHVVEVREALRAVLLAHTHSRAVPAAAVATLDAAACRARIRLRFADTAEAVLEPEAGGVNGALGRLLAIVHRAVSEGTWVRLKACRERSCAWAFYDHSKNRSGAWCDMEVCGNRAKARAFRERRASPRS